MSKEPRGLGRGLSALLGEVPNADALRKPVGYVNKEVVGARGRHPQDTCGHDRAEPVPAAHVI